MDNIQDRSEIRLRNAYTYVAEYFPELPETSRLVLAGCIVKALFPNKTAPDFQND
jgi:hypothetical protein